MVKKKTIEWWEMVKKKTIESGEMVKKKDNWMMRDG